MLISINAEQCQSRLNSSNGGTRQKFADKIHDVTFVNFEEIARAFKLG